MSERNPHGFRFGADQKEATWLSTATAARLLDKPNAKAFRQWARRNGVPLYRIGGQLRVDRRDLDTWIKQRRVA